MLQLTKPRELGQNWDSASTQTCHLKAVRCLVEQTVLHRSGNLKPSPALVHHLVKGRWEMKYTPSFTDIMPEILEESAQAVCGAG